MIVAVLLSLAWRLEAGSLRLDALAAAKARDSPPVLRRAAHLAWRRRWMRCWPSLVAVLSLLVAGLSDVWSGTDGCVLNLADLFLEK